ncbi:MAG: diguanylate cyclase [Desulfovibrionaceae bacterium]|nr:diguanylate cyclase [Desulfovibrionaceae bacterium]MBF0513694.1 diguanylate cyclase [Desulfovibrionaceae bacterium]
MMQKKLSEIITRDVVGVAPETLVSEAVALMNERRISCLPVLDRGRPVGIFTERNIVRFLSRTGGRADYPISEVMSSPVLTATADMFVYEAFHILMANRIRHLVVVDDDRRIIGVMTLSNIVDQIGQGDGAETQPVSEIMSRVVHTVDEDLPVREILTEMVERSISCVIYTERGKPVGMLTERDMASMFSRAAEFPLLTVTQVMRSPVLGMPKTATISEAASFMRAAGIRRVVVLDAEGGIAGLVTQSDIVRGLESKYIKILRHVIDEKNDNLKIVEQNLEEKSLFLDHILRDSLDMGIVAANKDLTVIYFNPAAESIMGVAAKEAIGKSVAKLHLPHGVAPERFASVLESLENDVRHDFTFEREIGEEIRYIKSRLSLIRDANLVRIGYLLVLQDVTEVKKAEENIRYMAFHDILTGLPNRISLNERLSLELARAQRNGVELALMMLDLDNFKTVNDTMGHYAGDILLQAVAERLISAVRKSDTIARLGGDEFIVVLPDLSDPVPAAEHIACKIMDVMQAPFDIKGQVVGTTLSMGIAFFPEHGTKRQRLFDAADEAMYRAKELGRENGRSNYILAGAAAPGLPETH